MLCLYAIENKNIFYFDAYERSRRFFKLFIFIIFQLEFGFYVNDILTALYSTIIGT